MIVICIICPDKQAVSTELIEGIIESYLGSELDREIRCNILDVNISKQKEECYVDMSIDIIE